MTPSLLVPIHIDALLVGTETKKDNKMFQWTDLFPDFWKLKSPPYSFGSDLYNIFAERRPPRAGTVLQYRPAPKAGIHLHFRLPRAFAHGHQEGADNLLFPAIPNRWLVQRFAGKPGAPADYKYKAWLIKSDADAGADKNGDPLGIPWPTIPEEQGKTVEVKSIGTCRELKAADLPLKEQSEPASVALTAVALGHPAFAAYYPACWSVLGFHDDATDLATNTRVSYLVTGWYSDSANDPLRELENWRSGIAELLAAGEPDAKLGKYTIAYLKNFLKSFRKKQPKDSPSLDTKQQATLYSELNQAWLEQHYWNCKDLANAAVLPSRVLCHGLVAGIDWLPAGKPPSPDVFSSQKTIDGAYNVSLGNTPAEALAALLVPGAAVKQDLLAAMQADLLGEQVTAEELRYALHARRFDGVGGGTTFFIQAEADDRERDTAANAEPAPTRQPAVIPGPLQKLLHGLNEKQSNCDRLTRMLEDGRWQVYALWYLETNERKSARQETNSDKKAQHTLKIKELERQLGVFKADFERVKRELKAALKDRNDVYNAEKNSGTIIAELGKYPKTDRDESVRKKKAAEAELKYRLVSSADRPFYKPSEPVIAVSGTGTEQRGTWQNPEKLDCRLSEQVLAGMKLQQLSRSDVNVSGKDLMAMLFAHDSLRLANLTDTDLLPEVLLLDAQHVNAIVALAYPADDPTKKDLRKQVTALQDPAKLNNPEEVPVGKGQWIGPIPARTAVLPDRTAVFNWEGNPWIPIFLVWDVSWQSSYPKPAGETLLDQLVVEHWELDRLNGDLKPKNGASGTGGSPVNFQGYSILTPTASKHLEEGLKKLVAESGTLTLLDRLRTMNVKLQSLDGFNDGLILQKAGMQLPPLSFKTLYADAIRGYQRDPIDEVLNEEFDSAEVRNPFRTAPMSADEPFLPIRAGQLAIKQLSIVNAFGQTLRLPVDTINESAGRADSKFHPAAVASSTISGRPRVRSPCVPDSPNR